MDNEDTHAFLIMAHNNKKQLVNLIKLLDYSNNELFVHIDKKVHLIDDEELLSICKHSKVHILRSVNVAWGAYSQIKCEILLLQSATRKKHAYYHLISGTDLPIKSNEEIHQFFYEHRGKQFIHFQSREVGNTTIEHVRYYHFLQEYTNAYCFFVNKIIRMIEHIFLGIQKLMGVNRWNNYFTLQKGANWFSISDELAKYIVAQKDIIEKLFSNTLSGDELFLQTIVINSRFKDDLYKPSFDDNYDQCVRYVDWKRGHPYVFQLNDLQEVLTSGAIFARKCSFELSQKIVEIRNFN